VVLREQEVEPRDDHQVGVERDRHQDTRDGRRAVEGRRPDDVPCVDGREHDEADSEEHREDRVLRFGGGEMLHAPVEEARHREQHPRDELRRLRDAVLERRRGATERDVLVLQRGADCPRDEDDHHQVLPPRELRRVVDRELDATECLHARRDARHRRRVLVVSHLAARMQLAKRSAVRRRARRRLGVRERILPLERVVGFGRLRRRTGLGKGIRAVERIRAGLGRFLRCRLRSFRRTRGELLLQVGDVAVRGGRILPQLGGVARPQPLAGADDPGVEVRRDPHEQDEQVREQHREGGQRNEQLQRVGLPSMHRSRERNRMLRWGRVPMPAALLLCLFAACSEPRSNEGVPPLPKNLVVLSIDTLRVDEVGWYSGLETTPFSRRSPRRVDRAH
jgi:hypothetical protein